MSYITQSCSDLVGAQDKLHRLSLYSAAFRREPTKFGLGVHMSLESAQRAQSNEVKRINAILSGLPAANDMDMHVGAA
jgi:hypothetical protein